MNIPKGATHVDSLGDYYKTYKHGLYTKRHGTTWGGAGFYDSFDSEVLGIKPLTQRKAEYPGQFEPWKDGFGLVEHHDENWKPMVNEACHMANDVIRGMMRC